MAFDALVALQNPVAYRSTTGSYSSTTLDLGGASPVRKPLWAQVRYYDAGTGTSTATMTFGIEDAADLEGPFNDHSAAPPVALAVAEAEEGKSGTIYLPITGARRYVRLTCDVTGHASARVYYDARLSDSQ